MVRLTDRPDMTLDVYRGRKTTTTWMNFAPRGGNSFFFKSQQLQFTPIEKEEDKT